MIFFLLAVHGMLNMCMKIIGKLAKFAPEETKFAQFFTDRDEANWQRALEQAVQTLKTLRLDTTRQTQLKIYWFHIASAGELEQAIPVARSISEGSQDSKTQVQFILSYTSPSAKPFIKNFPNTLFSFALPPFDAKRIRAVLKLFSPSALFFVRYDLWPLLIVEAKNKNVRLFLIGASSRLVRSGLLRLIGKRARKAILPLFDHVFAVNQQDANAFSSLLGATKVTLAGEPKWARAKERAENLRTKKSLLRAIQNWINPIKALTKSQVLVFGSPHSDEWEVIRMLLDDKETNFIIIIAPHEVNEAAVKKKLDFLSMENCVIQKLSNLLADSLEQSLESSELDQVANPTDTRFKRNLLEMTEAASVRLKWQQANSGKMIPSIEKNVLVVDSMGVLAEIYSAGDIAIVGGGFDGGLHNCLEPAAQGLPVLFGSKHQRAPEALELLNADAAKKFETKEDMFQFLKHCYNVQEKGCTTGSAVNLLPRMALNSARLFESVPKTNQIIRMHLTQYNET